MADVNKEIALKVTTNVDQTTNALQTAEFRLNEAKKAMIDLAMAGKQGSKEFRDLAVEAGTLKGKLELVEQTVDGIGKSTNKIEVFTGAVQGIAAGFAIAQGTAALFAEGNEELQEALVKVQASLALLQGTEQAVQLLRKESAAGQAILIGLQKGYAIAVRIATAATRSFTAALASTGIGALVVGLGILIAKLLETEGATKKTTAEMERATEVQKLLGQQIDLTNEKRQAEINLMEATGATAQQVAAARLKIIGEQLAALDESIAKEKENIQALAGFEDSVLFQKRKTILADKELRQANLQADLLKQLDIIAKANKEEAKQQDEKNKLAREKAKTAAQIQVELNQELENLQAQNIANEEARALKQLEIERSRARKQLEDKKASDALLIEFDKQSEIQRKEITDKAQAERDAKAKEDSDKVLANAKIVADALQQARIDSIKNEFDRAQAELEIQRQAKIEELTLAGASAEEINVVNQSFADKSVKIAKDAAAEQKAVKEAQIANDIDMTMQGLQALSDLAASFAGESEEQQKRAFAIQKGVSIAMAIIETYLSASKAYTSQLTPGDPTSPIRAYIAAGIAIAGGLARVNAIRKTQFKSTSPPANTGGGGGGIPTGGGGQQQPPAAFSPNVTPTNPTGQPNPQGGQNGTTRVIVVESDIRRVTTRVDAAERFATFGN